MPVKSKPRRKGPPYNVNQGKGNDVIGFVSWQARAYPVVAVPILCTWLALMGYLSPVVAIVVGLVLVVALQFGVRFVVEALLGPQVSLPGCFIGQIAYWVSIVVLLPLFYWQGGIDLLAIGALLFPLGIIGLAIIASRMSG